MPRKPVIIGLPLTLLARGLNSVGKPLSIAKTGVATAVLPWIGQAAKSAASLPTAGIAGGNISSTIGAGALGVANVFGSFTSLTDMSAQVVDVSEKRRMAVVSIPGRESDFLQDLGGHSTRYKISGKFFDVDQGNGVSAIQQIAQFTVQNNATGSTQLLRLVMRTAAPVPFLCEHEISMAIITDFNFSMVAGEPRWVNYNMNMIEYVRIPYLAKMAMLGISNRV